MKERTLSVMIEESFTPSCIIISPCVNIITFKWDYVTLDKPGRISFNSWSFIKHFKENHPDKPRDTASH